MNQPPRRDARSILYAIGGPCIAIFFIGLALIMLIFDVVDTLSGSIGVKSSLLETTLIASALIFTGVVLLPGSYYSIQRWRGKPVPQVLARPLTIRQGMIILLAWLAVSFLAQLLVNDPVLEWLAPPFYLASISLPALFLVRLAIGGLQPGSRQRVWGILGTGILLGPLPATLVEGVLAILAFLGLAVYLAFHPEQAASFKSIMDQLQNATTLDQVMLVIEPLLLNPMTILMGLIFFSGLTPLIEELAKSFSIWAIVDRLESPAQGFALGALSGAGFGLLESLLASASPDPSWAATLIIRGCSTMMHILTASLTGWGIAVFRTTKQPARMLGMYAVAFFLHSLWNACVIFITYGGLLTSSGFQGWNGFGLALVVLCASVLILLALSIPLAVGWMNRRLKPVVETPAPGLNLTPDLSLTQPEPGEDPGQPQQTGDEAGKVK